MDVEYSAEKAVSRIAAAIGEPARARILYCLLDGHARTSTELALVAEVSPSTASVHLTQLRDRGLVRVLAQGKHRYYSLEGAHTAAALEALMVVAVGPDNRFLSNTPQRLRAARTCYDHMAGTVAVALHDRFEQLGWLTTAPAAAASQPHAARTNDGGKRASSGTTRVDAGRGDDKRTSTAMTRVDADHRDGKRASSGATRVDALAYDVTPDGARALATLGIEIEAARALRRRFAYGCVDWSERKPHIAGALGAALLNVALKRKWLTQDLDSRALRLTRNGQRELQRQFGVRL
jgi:DNA-binding transcriptional ArsR family regulator